MNTQITFTKVVFTLLLNSIILFFSSQLSFSNPLLVPEAVTGFGYPLIGNFSNNGGYSFLTPAYYSGNLVYHPAQDWNQPSVPGGCGTGCNSDMCLDVVATAIGQVVYANANSWGGIVLKHNYQGQTWYSQYGHVRNIIVPLGQIVSKGEKIAEIGNQGTDCAHLHFEIREADHPDHSNGAFFPFGNSGLGSLTNVNNWYEDPSQFIPSHPAYNNPINAIFTVDGNSLSGWKFWKVPPIPQNFYVCTLNISNLPPGNNWALYTANSNGIIEPVATNQSGNNFTFQFSISTSNGNYPNGGGYKFVLTPQGQQNTIWAQSPTFYISSIPLIQVLVSPPELLVGQSATVSWPVSGGIPGLPYGGMTGSIRIQWYHNNQPKSNLVTVPLSSNSYTFIVPSSISGAIIPGCNFQLAVSNLPGSSIPEGYVFGFSNSFCINNLTNINIENDLIPKKSHLYQNNPNPFNPVTKVKFDLQQNGWVTLEVYDINGRKISTLVNENKTAGSYNVILNGSELPSGVYFYKLEAANFKQTRRMVIIK